MINIICLALAVVVVIMGVVIWDTFDDLDEAEKRVEELEERADYLIKELLK
jgi:uncharacterized protein YoxC